MTEDLSEERGGATIMLAWCCAAALALSLALLAGIGAVVAHAHVQAVADLAALHGGAHVSCSDAARVVARNDLGVFHGTAHLSRCEIDGAAIQVQVRTGGPVPVRASARAGPTW